MFVTVDVMDEMESEATNLQEACEWMDRAYGTEDGRRMRQEEYWQKRLGAELLTAVRKSDRTQVSKWLEFGASVNTKCKLTGDTAAHIAASIEDDSILQMLLENGASPSAKNLKGQEPIHVAVWNGRNGAVNVLCARDSTVVDSTIYSTEKYSTQNLLPQSSHADGELKELISEDFERGTVPLHIACSMNLESMVKLLQAKGAKVTNSTELSKTTPLDVLGSSAKDPFRTEKAMLDVYEIFVNNPLLPMSRVQCLSDEYRCKVARVERNTTALHTAVKFGYSMAIKRLLNDGACLGVWDAKGDTAIHLAIKNKMMKSLHAILLGMENKSWLDVRNRLGLTPLHLAAFLNLPDFVGVLLKAGANVTLTTQLLWETFNKGYRFFKHDYEGQFVYLKGNDDSDEPHVDLTLTACCWAVIGDNLDGLRLLSQDNPKLLTCTLENGMNLLHLAAWRNASQIIRFLLEQPGVRILKDSMCKEGGGIAGFGMAPIHFATYNALDTKESLKLLIEDGKCDTNVRAVSKLYGSLTILHCAVTMSSIDKVDVILKHDKKLLNHEIIKSVDEKRCLTAPHIAAVNRADEILRKLLSNGADLSLISHHPNHSLNLIDTMEIYTDDYVKVLKKILDSKIEEVGDGRIALLSYEIFVPDGEKKSQMGVLDAIVPSSEKVLERKSILFHPLTETFIYRKWKKLIWVLNVIVGLQMLMTLSISLLAYLWNVKKNPVIEGWQKVFRYIVAVAGTVCFIMTVDIRVKKLYKFLYIVDFWTLVWMGMFASSLSIATINTGSTTQWERGVAALAILLSWIELMYLLARYPWNDSFPMGENFNAFLTVAKTILQILSAFILLFVGFSLSFLVLYTEDFQDSLYTSFINVLMRPDKINENVLDSTSESIVGHLVLISFFFLVTISLMNFLTSAALDNISYVKKEGRARQIFEQIRTLSRLENIFRNWERISHSSLGNIIDVPSTLTVKLKEDIENNDEIPLHMAISIDKLIKKRSKEEGKQEAKTQQIESDEDQEEDVE